MTAHDWTRVEAGIFQDFHSAWTIELRNSMNEGLLPDGYYALVEQHVGRAIPDLLTLHAGPRELETPLASALEATSAGIAVGLRAPRVRRKLSIEPSAVARRRTLAVRHVSGHRLVALVEIVSPGNKDRRSTVEDFASKVVSALDAGVHVLLADLFPPGRFDPCGMHGVIQQRMEDSDDCYDLPDDERLTFASYAAGPRVEVYLEHLAVGNPVPDMPLFLSPNRYLDIPLSATYAAAYRGVPAFWRDMIERPAAPPQV